MMKVDVWIISDIFRVNERLIVYLTLLWDFHSKVIESKFIWFFLFVQLNSSYFKTVLTQHSYLLLLLEIWNANAQSYVKSGEWWDVYTFYLLLVFTKFLIACNINNQHSRSYKNIMENYFFAHHNNRPKHNQHFELLCFKLNSDFSISN